MTNGYWALIATLVLTTVLETLLKPRPRALWKRSPSAIGVHLATTLLHFAFWLLLVQRPWFAVVIAASLQMVIIQVSNTKSASLREPFLCQDFEYFIDAIRHPRLYIPFFGIGLTIASSTAGAIAIALGFWLEPSLFGRTDAPWVLAATLMLITLAALALGLLLHRLPACSLEPNDDLTRLGLYPCLWAYARLTRYPIDLQQNDNAFPQPKAPIDVNVLPHLVLVQSESFFDPRDWNPAIGHTLLHAYDHLMSEAQQGGCFDVPAWGANTVRTECAVLTGLTPEQLGGHRFNPYHQLNKQRVRNLAGALKQLGYRTVCIHPYPASFYLRDRVFPQLGFDTFIDIADFDLSERDGQYTGDLALAERVKKQLAMADEKPLFIFIISMENHGPLHLETPDPDIARDWVEGGITEGCEDLSVYLRHLHNTDKMLATLRSTLENNARPGMLAFYGDHVPIMPKVYAQHGEPDGLTHYFIWQTAYASSKNVPSENVPSGHGSSDNVRMTISADKLGTTIYDRILDHA